MFAELCHKALAERHHFSIGFSLRIEIRAALAAADWQTRQGIFENLLKTKEFDDAQIYGRMETQASLIGTDRAVKLHAESVIYLYLSLVIHPGNTELHDSLRNRQTLQKRILSVSVLIRLNHNTQGLQYLFYCLMELRLSGILRHN